jgi:hypothetical protein
MIRGGFGYAFRRSSCSPACHDLKQACALDTICPYRWVFETPRPPAVGPLHDLKDVPRPFVIEPPDDQRTLLPAGTGLEFGLVLIGRGVRYLPFFLTSFEHLAAMGLGRRQAKARLERVEALAPFAPVGQLIYQDGRAMDTSSQLPLIDAPAITTHAAQLPPDLQLHFVTPLRVKHQGSFLNRFDLPAIVQAICWRLSALTTFHGDGPWPVAFRDLVERAGEVDVSASTLHWVDLERRSSRGPDYQTMQLSGLMGRVEVRGVPLALRELLLLGSLAHIGKATVFGNGGYLVSSAR